MGSVIEAINFSNLMSYLIALNIDYRRAATKMSCKSFASAVK